MKERVSTNQKEALIHYMETHTAVAKKQFLGANGAEILEHQWLKLAGSLNSMSGAKKTTEEWMKCWSDIKAAVRKKATVVRSKYDNTGINGTEPIKSLDEYSQRVLSVMTIDTVDGDGETVECGLPHLPKFNLSDYI